MITAGQAEAFARAWLAAWNAHDLAAILAHYSDEVVFHSPRIAELTGEARDKLVGKTELARYWGRGLELLPDLHFEQEALLAGGDSLTILYRNERGRRVAETFLFDETGLVVEGIATYE